MKVKWLGHACFLITSEEGLKIITDPYSAGGGIKYGPVDESADIVTVSHDHFDHNAVATVCGRPEVVSGSGVKNVKGIEFRGIATYHDSSGGSERGANTVFCFALNGIKVCHLGDLGHTLSRDQVSQVGPVDVLIVPVGGFYTIDDKNASQVCDELKPKVIIPMHFKTPKLDFPIAGVDDFVKGKKNVRRTGSSEAEFKQGKLPEAAEIIILQPAL